MKQVVFHAYGEPTVLQVEDVPRPQPGPGEVLIRVAAAGVNYSDTMQRRNVYVEPSPLPFFPGREVAGTVEQVGEGVTSVVPGTPVAALVPHGGYAEYAIAPAHTVFVRPAGVEAPQALALLVQGLTAYLLLKHAGRLHAGQSVLVHAAAGGVGSLLVQLAKSLGAGQVIATASTEAKLELTRSLGADVAIEYTQADWAAQVMQATGGAGVDLVLDGVGGNIVLPSLTCLAPFGHFINYGNSNGDPQPVNPWQLTLPNHSVSGFYIGGYFGRPALIGEALGILFGQAASGELRVQVDQTFSLEQAAKAHHRLEGRQTVGKVVLVP